jgi:hypothetical protein
VRGRFFEVQLALAIAAGASAEAQSPPSHWTPGRNQIGLDGGVLSGGVSFARRLGPSRFGLGGGIWYAWEPKHDFDRNVWETGSVHGFVRYWLPPVLQIEAGPAVLQYVWSDDCSDCNGSFAGVRLAGKAGYRYVFVGPAVWIGWVSDRRYGSQFGTIIDLQITITIGFGR